MYSTRPTVLDGRRELVREQLADQERILRPEQRREPGRFLEVDLDEMLERRSGQFAHQMRLANLPRAAQDQRLPRRAVLPEQQLVEQVPFHQMAFIP